MSETVMDEILQKGEWDATMTTFHSKFNWYYKTVLKIPIKQSKGPTQPKGLHHFKRR